MKIGIAILNWNGADLLEKFLPHVLANSEQARIYVIDNHSTDKSLSFVRENFPQIKIIDFPKNYGYAKAYNLAIEQIEEEIICCLNSDVKVTANWLPPIERLFQENSKIAAIQPKILSYHKPEYFEYAGAAGGFLDNWMYPYCRGRVFWTEEKDHGQYDDEREIFWASGASLFLRKSAFLEVGGFDEDFFAHQEEIDLCWRLKNFGHQIFYTYKSSVYHIGAASLTNRNPKKTYLNFRNNLLMIWKNLPFLSLLYILPIRLVLDGITAIVFLRYEGFSHLLAIAKSHFGFYVLLPKFSVKRGKNKIQSYHSLHKFIPYQYFIYKRETFDKLK